MAGIFLVKDDEPGFAQAALAGARVQFAKHGFPEVTERQLPGWHLLHAPHILGGPESLLVEADDLVAVAGTFTCDGLMGRPALQALLDMPSLERPDWSRLGGQFVALVHKHGRSYLFTDFFAAFQLFHDPDLRIFSTSMLSALAALPRLSFDPQGVYEFAFNVVPIGNDTIVHELKLLGPDAAVLLDRSGASFRPLAKPLPEAPVAMPLTERIEQHRALLGTIVRKHAAQFGDRMFCALSGGLDSRLVLAALRAEGCRPNVFVYGREAGPDVRLALAIGAAKGFGVEWVNKDEHRDVQPEEFGEIVEHNFQAYDALPNFGELFENGGNIAALYARHEGGALSVSGGCGEVYRNFFFLPDRPISAATLAQTFFARFTPGDLTAAFDEKLFLGAIEDKILRALGRPGDRSRLPRVLIEQVYPRLRCRSFFGREISIEGRHAPYLMPFLDHSIVSAGLTLPLELKNAGRFEAMLINAIDPELARQPSAYGHDFAGPPSFRHQLSEWSTRVRPVWLRQKSYAIQRRLGTVSDDQGGLMIPDYLGRVVDLDYPAMRRFFVPERIADSGLMRRIACLEYLAAYLGSKLSA